MTLRRGVLAVIATLAAIAAWGVSITAVGDGISNINEAFGQRNGLITNEWAYHHRQDPRAHKSSRWLVTSGSLFARNGKGYSGVPDTKTVDAQSKDGTGSSVFRMVSRVDTLDDTQMTVKYKPLSWATDGGQNDWSGFHIFLRYQSETNLYVASVQRKDGTITIKKKTPGGDSNGGTYTTLAEGKISPLPMNREHTAVATIRGADPVHITLNIDGRDALTAVDDDETLENGRIGIRTDDLQFEIDSITTADA